VYIVQSLVCIEVIKYIDKPWVIYNQSKSLTNDKHYYIIALYF